MGGFAPTFLVNAFWQVSLVAVTAWAAGELTTWASARYRHRLFVTSLLAAVVLPWIAAWSAMPADPSSLASATAAVNPEPFLLRLPPGTISVLVGAYLSFVAYRAACLVWAFFTMRQIVRTARPETLPGDVGDIARKTRAALGLAHVPLLFSETVPAPLTLGWRRPVVVLPEGLLDEDSGPVWTAVLGHELAHVQRRDFLVNLILEIATLPLAFHPGVRFLSNQVRATREQACDEMVSERLLDSARYARSLMQVAAQSVGGALAPEALAKGARTLYSLALFEPNTLEERIMRLIDKRTAPRGLALHLGSVLIAGVTAGASLVSVAVEAKGGTLSARIVPVAPVLQILPPAPTDEPNYDARGRRDPFVNVAKQDKGGTGGVPTFAIESVKLQGIVKTRAQHTAVIVGPDNKTYFVREGERFYDGTLVRMDEGSLVFLKQLSAGSGTEIRVELR